MTEILRRTMRSFLRWESPATPGEADRLLRDWFGRYGPEPGMVEEEVARHFEAPPEPARRPWPPLGE